ncbi:MAG: insulinase family protein [Candidatus Margulisbacteria bacterium]|nr:insulinase family protein [Candidatus Margulisiibacteriota bacterium]
MELSLKIDNLGRYGAKGININFGRRNSAYVYGRGPIANLLNSPLSELTGQKFLRAFIASCRLPYDSLVGLARAQRAGMGLSLAPDIKQLAATQTTPIMINKVWDEILSNGVRLRFDLQPGLPYVAMVIKIKGAGRLTETQRELAHTAEHLLASQGLFFSGQISLAETIFQAVFQRELFPELFSQALNSLFNPTFNTSTLEREIGRIMIERDNFRFARFSDLRAVPHWPQLLDQLRIKPEFKSFTVSQLKGFVDRHYLGGNAEIYLSGDFNPMLARMIAEKSVPSGKYDDRPPPFHNHAVAYIIKYMGNFFPLSIIGGAQPLPAKTSELLSLLLIRQMLGQGAGSWLNQELSVKRGLCYVSNCELESVSRLAFFNMYLQTNDPAKAAESIETILAMVRQLNEALFPNSRRLSEQKESFKNYLMTNHFAGCFRGEDRVFDLLPPMTLIELLNSVETLSLDEVRSVASAFINPQELSLIAYLDERGIATISGNAHPWHGRVHVLDNNLNEQRVS